MQENKIQEIMKLYKQYAALVQEIEAHLDKYSEYGAVDELNYLLFQPEESICKLKG